MNQTPWDLLVERISELDTLTEIGGLLAWDQQVAMPAGSAAGRAAQSELIARLIHERSTSAELGELIEAVGDLPTCTVEQAAAVRNLRRNFKRSAAVPLDLTLKLANANVTGVARWSEAKAAKSFDQFKSALQTNVDLAIERARAIDPSRPPYDVLLEDHDPGTKADDLRKMFGTLQQGLTDIRTQALARKQADALTESFDVERQMALHQDLIRAVGYDVETGMLAEAEHPFSCRVGSGDVRIATHVHERNLLGGLAATMHEVGHGLYEQGLPSGPGGSAVHAATSTGMHESQSRLWENMIGRSRAFYQWLAPLWAKHFPDRDFDPDEIYAASNRVNRGSIRIFADEVSYNLHIILRFEIEIALIERTITVDDVPTEWARLSEKYLGVPPADDAEGPLQDAHWAGGAFGYFPSYTLGNLYAASLFAALQISVPDLDARIAAGDFACVLDFMRDRIHRHGHVFETPELLDKAVGPRDHVDDLLTYLRERYSAAR